MTAGARGNVFVNNVGSRINVGFNRRRGRLLEVLRLLLYFHIYFTKKFHKSFIKVSQNFIEISVKFSR